MSSGCKLSLLVLSGIVATLWFASPVRADAMSDRGEKIDGEPSRPRIDETVERDHPREAQEFFLRQRLPAGEKDFSPEVWLSGLARVRMMPRAVLRGRRTLSPLAAVGPDRITEEDGWVPLGPSDVGGRTRALVIDPRNPNLLYAGGVAGGVWKSFDQGESWEPVGDFLPNLAVTALAMDPVDSNVLYAGTGEGFDNLDAVRGAGIFKSINGGVTWTRLGSTANPNFFYVMDLVVSAKNRARLYAATRSGVFRSLNSGASWTRILNPGTVEGCTDLAIRTDRTDDVVFAACGISGPGTIWRNPRAQLTSSRFGVVLRETGMGRTSLAIAPSNQNVVFALASSTLPGPGFTRGCMPSSVPSTEEPTGRRRCATRAPIL